MNENIVKLWQIKANNDLKAGRDELITESPATDTVCFHMQQCAEKYLKSYLVFKGKEISKTHNIAFLLQQCIEMDSSFEELKNASIALLTIYSVESRYPDDFYMPSIEETQKAVDLAEKTKGFVLNKTSV